MSTFAETGLSERALAAVAELGYDAPTPVQERAIPAVLAGRDVIAAAKTGTGKTAAFSLPALDRLEHARHGQGPLMLVVTPTRELALQIEEVCGVIARHTHHRVSCVVGGVAYGPQVDMLARGTDVLIATPGRLVDLLDQGAADLGQVGLLVLDEADRMLDMGFLPAMRRIVGRCPDWRQTLLFSATIDAAIEDNMANLLADPVFVEIAKRGEVADTVDQYVMHVDQRAKFELLSALLHERGSERVIVFCRTRHRADNIARKLKRAGFRAAPIHSDRSQNQRKRALDEFAAGKIDIIVATDVLARGIDVSEVAYVVNMDLPMQAEDYVHRIGRTGRAGEDGFAVSFVTTETEDLLREVEKLVKRQIPALELASWDDERAAEVIARKEGGMARPSDPEVEAVKRELKAKEKAAARAAERKAAEPQQEPAEPAKQKRRRRKKRGAGSAQNAPAPAPKPAPKPQASRGEKPRKPKGNVDVRPGRAQRAQRRRGGGAS